MPLVLIAIVAALNVEKIGRRKLFLISNAGMLFAYILWTVGAGVNANNPSNRNAANLVMAAVFICVFFDLDPPKSFPLRQQARAVSPSHLLPPNPQ